MVSPYEMVHSVVWYGIDLIDFVSDYDYTVWYGIDFVSDYGYIRWTNLKNIKKNYHSDRALTSLTYLKKLKKFNIVIVRR